jgi:hypothetical protein
MIDLEIHLEDRPGTLAAMGHALGAAGISVEGGGAWVIGGKAIAHFLVRDGIRAQQALTAAGITVAAAREVVLLRLKQEVPGQLALLTGAMAEAGVNIETLYSDHDHQLVLVVDDMGNARRVAAEWTAAGDQ